MKTSLLFKVLLGLPLILLADYLLMVLLGCASCLFSLGKEFYCGTYCFIGKGILLLSAGLFLYMILPELKHFLKQKRNAPTD
jgi:hypothetical protein